MQNADNTNGYQINGYRAVFQYQTYMTWFVVANIPFIAAFGLGLGQPVVVALVLQVLMAALALVALPLRTVNRAFSFDLSAISLALTPAVLVYMLQGHPWQLDAHMYFFANLAMLIGFKSMRAALVASAAIAVHHLTLNFILPLAVFPGGSDFFRVLFHATIVIVETAVILVTIHGIQVNDTRIENESKNAKDALNAAEEAKRAQEKSEFESQELRKQTLNTIASDFDEHIGGLISTLGTSASDLQATARAVRIIADKTNGSSRHVAQSSQAASQNVTAVASAMEEMSATSGEIAGQMASVRTKSNDAAMRAEGANKTVLHLDTLARNIGEVVEAIRTIAEQTNLLALNATIEAARAGESGRGFSVVADEVKKLATETARKTEEINQRIVDIQNAASESVTAMENIIGNIADIDQAVAGVSAAVEEQNATTQEIVRSIAEASHDVGNVSNVIADVERGADETKQSSDAVLNAAGEMAKMSEKLQAMVQSFLGQIRQGT